MIRPHRRWYAAQKLEQMLFNQAQDQIFKIDKQPSHIKNHRIILLFEDINYNKAYQQFPRQASLVETELGWKINRDKINICVYFLQATVLPA